jgi:hypothetical protein
LQLEEITAALGEVLKETEVFTREERHGFALTKVVLRLADGSSLRVWEKYRGSRLEKYSYYWLDPANACIMGWDNAPHHRTVPTFPHHKHIGKEVCAAKEKLPDILALVRGRLR